MTGFKKSNGLRGLARGLGGLLATAVVLSLVPAPAPAAGLFENIFNGLNRTFNGAPPPPPPEPVTARPGGYYPTDNAPRPWRGAVRHDNASAGARQAPHKAPMGDPTLRPGDVVATTDGLRVYTGGRRGLPDFVPVKSYPYFGKSERSQLMAMQVTPPDRRWNAEAPPTPATTTSMWSPDAFNGIRTAQR